MQSRLEKLSAYFINVDTLGNNRVAYGEMVALRRKDGSNRNSKAIALWNAVRGS